MNLVAIRERARTHGSQFWVVVLTLGLWPVSTLEHVSDIDGSAFAALHMTANKGIDYGTEFLLTYGPLGWLAVPRLFYLETAAGAVAIAVIAQAALVALLLRRGHILFGSIGGPIFALGLVGVSLLVPLPEVLLIIIFILCTEHLRAHHGEGASRGKIASWAAICALMCMIKVSVGIASIVLVLVTLAFSRTRTRNLVFFAAAFLLFAITLWTVTGQQPSDLPPFLWGSLEIFSGYSTAVTLTAPVGSPSLIVLFTSMVLVATIVCLRSEQGAGQVQRGVLTFVLICFGVKSGFVRQDSYHLNIYLTFLFFALAMSLPKPTSTKSLLSLLALSVATLDVFAFTVVSPQPQLSPLKDVSRSFDQVGTLLDPDRAASLLDANRRVVQNTHPLDDVTLSLLIDQQVHVDPWQADVVWAHPAIHWRPLPIIQSFMAFTERLDAKNAAMAKGEEAPELILRQDRSFEDRSTTLDPPRTQLAILCNYASIRTTARWQLLSKTSDRCHDPRIITEATETTGVEVPAPDSHPRDNILAVRILGLTTIEDRLRAFLFRREPWFLLVDEARYRLNPLTAIGPMVLGIPPEMDFQEPFRIGGPPGSLTVIAPRGQERSVRFEFLSIEVDP